MGTPRVQGTGMDAGELSAVVACRLDDVTGHMKGLLAEVVG